MILTHGANSLVIGGGGDIGNLFHYKSNFKNFDIPTMTDYPIEGNPLVYTVDSGSPNLQNDVDGLVLNKNSGSVGHVLNEVDFTRVTKIKRKFKLKPLSGELNDWSWAWNGNNTLNLFSSRGAGLWMFNHNLTPNPSFIALFSETHNGVSETMYTPQSAYYPLNTELIVDNTWTDDGNIEYWYNGVNAGSNTDISMQTDYFKNCCGFGTQGIKLLITGIEIDIWGNT